VIEACIVNHNCSQFSELALRSLVATNRGAGVHVSVVDNHSTDPGVDALREATDALGARFVLARWPAESARVNSHGEVLRDFVLDHSGAEFYLFVDADVVFTRRPPWRTHLLAGAARRRAPHGQRPLVGGSPSAVRATARQAKVGLNSLFENPS